MRPSGSFSMRSSGCVPVSLENIVIGAEDAIDRAQEWVDTDPKRKSFTYGGQPGSQGIWLQLNHWHGSGHHWRLRVDLGLTVGDIERAIAGVARRVKMEGGQP